MRAPKKGRWENWNKQSDRRHVRASSGLGGAWIPLAGSGGCRAISIKTAGQGPTPIIHSRLLIHNQFFQGGHDSGAKATVPQLQLLSSFNFQREALFGCYYKSPYKPTYQLWCNIFLSQYKSAQAADRPAEQSPRHDVYVRA